MRSNLCDYSDACILVNGTATINSTGVESGVKRLDG